jgi:two-component system, NarL family, response regulator YdfI
MGRGGGVIRLLIVAPSPVVRAGLEALLAGSSDVLLAGAQEDFTAVESLRPDVVLAAVEPEELAPARAIVVLSGAVAEWTQEMLRAGVRAVLPANATPAEILAAIHAAAAGLAAIDPEELDGLLAPASRTAFAAPQPLTARELDVLRMMAEGAANKTIAWKLTISEHTVKFHVASIMTKLDAGSRTEAVTIGIRHGLILI